MMHKICSTYDIFEGHGRCLTVFEKMCCIFMQHLRGICLFSPPTRSTAYVFVTDVVFIDYYERLLHVVDVPAKRRHGVLYKRRRYPTRVATVQQHRCFALPILSKCYVHECCSYCTRRVTVRHLVFPCALLKGFLRHDSVPKSRAQAQYVGKML